MGRHVIGLYLLGSLVSDPLESKIAMPVVNQSGRSDVSFITLLYIRVSMGWIVVNFLIKKLWSFSNPGDFQFEVCFMAGVISSSVKSFHSFSSKWLNALLSSSIQFASCLTSFSKFVSRNYLFQLMMEDLLFQFAVLSYFCETCSCLNWWVCFGNVESFVCHIFSIVGLLPASS